MSIETPVICPRIRPPKQEINHLIDGPGMLLLMTSHADCFTLLPQSLLPFPFRSPILSPETVPRLTITSR